MSGYVLFSILLSLSALIVAGVSLPMAIKDSHEIKTTSGDKDFMETFNYSRINEIRKYENKIIELKKELFELKLNKALKNKTISLNDMSLKNISKKINDTDKNINPILNPNVDSFFYHSQIDLLHLILKNYAIDNKHKPIEFVVLDSTLIESLSFYIENMRNKNKLEGILFDNKKEFDSLYFMSPRTIDTVFAGVMSTIESLEYRIRIKKGNIKVPSRKE